MYENHVFKINLDLHRYDNITCDFVLYVCRKMVHISFGTNKQSHIINLYVMRFNLYIFVNIDFFVL